MNNRENQKKLTDSLNYARELGKITRQIKAELELEKAKNSNTWRELRDRYRGYTYPHEIINTETDIISRKRMKDLQDRKLNVF